MKSGLSRFFIFSGSDRIMDMKNILIWSATTLILIGGIAAIVWKIKTPDISVELSKPWIEVIKPAVFEISENGNEDLRELMTGDELTEKTGIRVEKTGLANIHFPDGSVARLDGGTKLMIENGSFNPETGTLSVTLNLVWGRVWSKIIGLATPESHWEVKTSTAVATVRGTAFGVEYVEEGKSNIVGYENKVEVGMIDPDTKEVMDGVKMLVEPEKLLEVRKEAVAEMKKHMARNDMKETASAVTSSAGALLMEVRQAPKAMMDKDWVRRGIEEDRKLQEKIDRIKKNIKDEVEVRKEMRKEIRNDFLDKINERRENLKTRQAEAKEKITDARDALNQKVEERREQIETAKTEIREAATAEAQKKTEVQESEVIREEVFTAKKPVGLRISSKEALTTVEEGRAVEFRAILEYSDGSSSDVTDSAKWQVVGSIGVMHKPGIFVAGLGRSVSELGIAPGAISASWSDETAGLKFEGQSPIFKVEMLIDMNFDPNRG